MRLAFVLLLVILGTGCRSTNRKPSPKFEDYPAAEIFKGKPAPPQPSSPEERAHIADVKLPDRPNFAGHYFVVEGPNVPDYAQVVIVDALTGRLFGPPLAGKGGVHAGSFTIPIDPFDPKVMEYRLDSKLVVLPHACPGRTFPPGVR